MMPLTFGEQVAEYRKRLGMAQRTLSEATGIPMTTLRNHEYGNRELTAFHLFKYAKALGVKVDSFADCVQVTKRPDRKDSTKDDESYPEGHGLTRHKDDAHDDYQPPF